MARQDRLDGFVERQVVAVQQLLEEHRDRAKPPRDYRWPPLSPSCIALVEEVTQDDGREVRPEGAAFLELAENLVVVLHQLQPDVPSEIVGLASADNQ